jgi:hypothetical protein
MYLNDTETAPLYASLHDMLSLLIFPGGKNYTYRDTIGLLESVGFDNVVKKRMSMFNVNSLVTGQKSK